MQSYYRREVKKKRNVTLTSLLAIQLAFIVSIAYNVYDGCMYVDYIHIYLHVYYRENMNFTP